MVLVLMLMLCDFVFSDNVVRIMKLLKPRHKNKLQKQHGNGKTGGQSSNVTSHAQMCKLSPPPSLSPSSPQAAHATTDIAKNHPQKVICVEAAGVIRAGGGTSGNKFRPFVPKLPRYNHDIAKKTIREKALIHTSRLHDGRWGEV